MTTTENLEHLISLYTAAIDARNVLEIERLSQAVEQEADTIGYTNHARLMALHTQAERASIEGEKHQFNNLSILQRAAEMSDRVEAIVLVRQALNLPETGTADRMISDQYRWERIQNFSRLMEIGQWLNAECMEQIERDSRPVASPVLRDLMDHSRGARRTHDG